MNTIIKLSNAGIPNIDIDAIVIKFIGIYKFKGLIIKL